MKLFNSITIATCLIITACSNNSTPAETETPSEKKIETASNSESKTVSNDTTSEAETITQDALPTNAPIYQVVGFNYTPYLFQDEVGNSTGFEVDLLRAIGNEQGIRFHFSQMPYDQVLSTLAEGSADLAMSGLILTPERQEKFEHSEVYSLARLGYMVKASSTLTTPEAVSQVKIATIKDSPVHKGLVANGVAEENLVFESSVFLLFQSLFNGNAEASSGTEASLIYTANQFPDKEVRFVALPKQFDIVTLAKKGNTDLIAEINEGFAKIQANGKYTQINKKWFGDSAKSLMVE